MKNNEKILFGAACFLGGVVAGFLIAPIKKGVYCGNNNGNYVGTKEELASIIDKNLEDKEIVQEVNEE
ncbi:Uncharacterised protein [uncultured Clostridium sp.]|uniref:hypothetical protein n=1 Tax=uncultured Clostridium sp. TaxID=59620 RepID=UPI000822A826|nr:hypothetical protein [uncultured Clostridium sp.]SCJ97419.1 Uncharacterised protein [uncultured Clostridium sp.]